jgi:UDP-glucose 4-epimerase
MIPGLSAAASSTPRHVLLTGGLGYIGSHLAIELLRSGYRVTILDNLANSEHAVLARIEELAQARVDCTIGDVRSAEVLAKAFARSRVNAVIHCAGLKAVADSSKQPVDYYDVNVGGSFALLKAMQTASVKTIVFSSSATVYGSPGCVPLRESHIRNPNNPYGRTKSIVEQLLEDLHASDPSWSIAALRYFNPAGAHSSGLIGENPRGVPNNLFPFIAQVAEGLRPLLKIFASDYDTDDGTAVRDYIHVMDLADAHQRALGAILNNPGYHAVNLGTGRGHSVREVLRAYEQACGFPIRHRYEDRRDGDVATTFADSLLAEAWLGWKAQRGLTEMCADSWRYSQASAHTRVRDAASVPVRMAGRRI